MKIAPMWRPNCWLTSLDAPAVDDPETVRTLGSQELDRRARRALSGEAAGEDWPSGRQRLADDLAG